MVDIPLAQRESVFEVEEGTALAPKFDEKGLIPVVTTDSKSGEVLMHGYICLLYTSPSPRDGLLSRMPSSA